LDNYQESRLCGPHWILRGSKFLIPSRKENFMLQTKNRITVTRVTSTCYRSFVLV